MKIAQITATFPPYPGGMGYVCYHNARVLAQRGHDVTVFTLDYGDLEHDNDPKYISIVRLKTVFRYGRGGMVPRLYSKLKDFDVIHLHYPFFGGAEYIYLVSLLRDQKYFLTYHQDAYGDSFLKRLIMGVYDPILMRQIIRRAVRIGALSFEHLKNSKAARFVNWDKVVELPNGVDVEAFAPRQRDESLLEKYGLSGKVIILFVGHLMLFKGLHILIDALSKIENDNVALFIVGEGPLEMELKKQVIDRGLQSRVIFEGYKSQTTELAGYYNACDFLVLPSISDPESFGMVILEAMASGKPAIVSSLPGPSQLIEDNRDGLIVKAGDSEDLQSKIKYLVSEREIRQEMGRVARAKVIRKYSWAKIGERLEKVLEEIL